ncbi:MAG TPA: penicillin-binding protein 2 [Gemmatimonadales bacterium]|nr:penicillin-binding protein 2 [Gemmatimonadales bacterium]
MNEFRSHKVLERANAARWTLVAAFVVLAGAFFRTQILQHEKYRLKAETNRLRPVPLTPPRGHIFDRHGRIIAETVPGYSVKLLAASADSLRAVLERFRRIVPLDDEAVDAVVRRYRQATFQPALVLGDASFETVSRLQEHSALLPGLVIQTEPKRHYPAGKAVAHLVGYVGEVTESDLKSPRYAGLGLGTLVGKAGLEQQYDSALRGTAGLRYIEVNALGRMVREEGAAPPLPPVPGRPLRTTIDLELQRFIDSIWPVGVRGAMVALSTTGEVLALYSAPTYDPNVFIGGIPAAEWRALNTDEARPLLNRAVQVRYPPASTFKLATAIMGLRRGLVDFDTRMPIPCRGGMQFGNRYFRCWKREGHGDVDLTAAVAKSCDVYFYQLGLRIGLKGILDDGIQMGFGERAGIDLVNEVKPIYPASTDYYDKRYGPRGWSNAVILNLSIGQGENTQTLLNMVRFYQALAGDGKALTPRVVPGEPTRSRDLGLTAAQIAGLREALIAVVERGTAGATRSADLRTAGKTGTAQNPHGKDHGWYVGFAPADRPRIVVGAIMEFAEHGSTVAPYVVRVMRRHLLGPEPPGERGRVRIDVPRDSAPPPLEIPIDSPPPAPAPTVSAAGPVPR